MTMDAPLHIVELRASNVKRLRAVTIRPDEDGNLVVLSGRNGAGKTSVLDAITMALAGKDHVCQEPIRRGEDHAAVTVDLGDLVVRRTFTAGGGGSLTVCNRDGARYTSPQTMLDALMGKLTFDPLAFTRAAAKERAEVLRRLVGLDFTAMEVRREKVFDTRRQVNAEAKALRARALAIQVAADAPDVEQPIADVIALRDEAQRKNVANARARYAVSEQEARCSKAREDLEYSRDEIRRLQAELAAAVESANAVEAELASEQKQLQEMATAAAALVDEPMADHNERLRTAEDRNQKARAKAQRAELEVAARDKESAAAILTADLEAIDRQRAAAIAAAPMPVPGLSFAADGSITLNDLPLEQASGAEQLRVSVAIGLAMNPRLRVLLIRDGSLLDTDSLRMVADMARQAGAQVWMERVERDAMTTVVIEDGSVMAEAAEVVEKN